MNAKRNGYFKIVCRLLVCAFLLAGCSHNQDKEEQIFSEDGKKELEEEKQEGTEMETIGKDPEVICAETGQDIFTGRMEPQFYMTSPTDNIQCITVSLHVPEDHHAPRLRLFLPCLHWRKELSSRRIPQGIGAVKYSGMKIGIKILTSRKRFGLLAYGITDNTNRSLTGFWLESSLMISPREQVEVMERIFGENADYSEETQNELKQVMLVSEEENADISLYGKTGMGTFQGVVADAWFTGFAESAEGTLCFCIYLGRTDGMDISSSLAKEIAIRLVSDYFV